MKLRLSLILGAPVSLLVFSLLGFEASANDRMPQRQQEDPPEIALGERLFRETRFAQRFFSESQRLFGGDVNAEVSGEPILETFVDLYGQMRPGPFRGQTMSCVACHMVDETRDVSGAGIRTYADFWKRTPIPLRGDGLTHTLRNTPALVNATIRRDQTPLLQHFDGEFVSLEDLVLAGWSGRNLGWLESERGLALSHIARVLREDTGRFSGGVSYLVAFQDPALPQKYRLRVKPGTPPRDSQLIEHATRLVAAYLNDLKLEQDSKGRWQGSAWDEFLERNGLPRLPRSGESPESYSAHLAKRLARLTPERMRPVFPSEQRLETHPELVYQFGAQELQGAKLFFGRARCVSCHVAPDFTNHRFHNVGVTQLDYDDRFGKHAFLSLPIPQMAERARKNYVFEAADLGLWSVLFNPKFPKSQPILREILRLDPNLDARIHSSRELMLSSSVGRFKTPGLRNLGHSAPYFHSGRADTLRDVIEHYAIISTLAQKALVRNADPELLQMSLTMKDADALAAFLNALNQDYD